mmetsp:Transcript_75926/g.246390  ORF Transcript_75926/g.246390 Transcript_75926/m.246390 type:complete len:205 (+) Transcript_75926:263-877(+)
MPGPTNFLTRISTAASRMLPSEKPSMSEPQCEAHCDSGSEAPKHVVASLQRKIPKNWHCALALFILEVHAIHASEKLKGPQQGHHQRDAVASVGFLRVLLHFDQIQQLVAETHFASHEARDRSGVVGHKFKVALDLFVAKVIGHQPLHHVRQLVQPPLHHLDALLNPHDLGGCLFVQVGFEPFQACPIGVMYGTVVPDDSSQYA